ncbi:MAG: GT4 family glycosyltransferase PelF, partial [Planctomycetota bacterium]
MRSTTETALADVCFVLEGTYPFVAGGVSSWVHHLVTHLPELTFTILHISAKRGCYEKRAYDVPGNVLDVEELYLHEPFSLKGLLKRRAPREKVRTLSGFIRDLRDGETAHFPDLVKAMQSLRSSTRPDDLLLDRGNWNSLTEGFKSEAPEESFLNYFWNWYYAHQPLVNILAAPLPDAGMYHTVSTGYAGVLAAAASLRWNRPMILTEHGIYTKERRIEIYSAEWIKDREGDSVTIEREAPYFRRFWNRQFRMKSRITYEQAAEIF